MSNNRLALSGVDELREALRNLPQELLAEATDIVDDEAELARAEIFQSYPRRTGNLRNGMSIDTKAQGTAGIAITIKNTARHAWLYENGTQARHTALGADRGTMPAGHAFIPPIIRHRRRKDERLRALVESHGLVVTGSE